MKITRCIKGKPAFTEQITFLLPETKLNWVNVIILNGIIIKYIIVNISFNSDSISLPTGKKFTNTNDKQHRYNPIAIDEFIFGLSFMIKSKIQKKRVNLG